MASLGQCWNPPWRDRRHDRLADHRLQVQLLLADSWLALPVLPHAPVLVLVHLPHPRVANVQLAPGLHQLDHHHVELRGCRHDLYPLERTPEAPANLLNLYFCPNGPHFHQVHAELDNLGSFGGNIALGLVCGPGSFWTTPDPG